MKKLILSLIAVVMTAGAINAGQNKSIKEARIYINPGHGSWTGNDRNMPTINHPTGDTTGFYESNTDLWKGLKLRQILIDWGMPAENICMSRVKNGPYPHNDAEAEKYNRNLTEIARECNSFNADYFISIHSDAGLENHTILIHKGYTVPAEDADMHCGGDGCVADSEGWHTHYGDYSTPENPNTYGSKELMQICSDMANTTWPYLNSNGIDVMNSSYMQPGRDPYIRGDYTFYKGWNTPADKKGQVYTGYLGVLNRNITPGFLSEGFSHQYYPATHRALNPDYCGQEGLRYARGMAEWFGWEKDPKGYIMGSVKDMHTRLEHQYYNYAEGSIDQWMPINNVEVTLYKGGVEIATYKGDNEWNGVFVFEKLEPGDDYTILAKAPGYKSNYELAEILGKENEMPVYTVVANETTYPIIYLETEDYEPNPCYNYPDPEQERWLKVAGKYEMRQDYVNKSFAELEGKTIRRELAHGDSIYALAIDAENNPHIYCYNAKTQELYFELSTEGVGDASDEREMMKISDIAFTSDSVLVACNLEHMSFAAVGEANGTLRFYKWAKDDVTRSPIGNPEIWFTSTHSNAAGNFSNATTGQSLAISGRLENCKVITTAKTQSGVKIRIPIFTISRKGLVEQIRNQSDDITTETIGEDYRIVVSPRDDNAIVLDGSICTPSEFALNSTDVGAPTKLGAVSADLLPVATVGANYFKYAKHALMVTPKLNAEGKVTGVELYDVQDGFDKAKLIETTNTDIDAAECAYVMVSSHVEEDDITLYLNKDNTVSRFTTQDVEQTYYGNVYAYDLDVTAADGNYTFTFKANEDCLKGGKLIFYDETSKKVGEIALDNVVAGANEKVVAATELPGTVGQVLSWAVEVSSYNVTHILPLLSKDDYKLSRAYVTVDNSPVSATFGKTYVSDYLGASKTGNGVYVYDQDYVKENETAHTTGVKFNTNQGIALDMYGNVYVADNAAANSGVYRANQNDFTFSQFFEGTRTSGVISNNGVEVGGMTSSVAFIGDKMYTYSKNTAGKYVINIYDMSLINTFPVTSWSVAPTQTIAMPKDMTADASIAPVEQGVWVVQTLISTGNKETSPVLMFVDNDGNVTFNQGLAQNHYLLSGAAGSALAATKDGKTLVVNDENGVFQFYDVEWNGSTPTLTSKYSYEHEIGVGAKRIQDGVSIEQMTFDYAGRLVASGHYLGVFSIPTENNVCETPARRTVTCGQASVAIENVKDDTDAPVEFYNLQGVKVANPENGIFIKKQGSKATKVVL
ncbi:MAG: N-acetylmuramoyl-L-alanine amidase [Muribaculaceae bacterium]|nr:N-acetylmuramoyl-L-alanine amidase [Muribaculaceae bacterium]